MAICSLLFALACGGSGDATPADTSSAPDSPSPIASASLYAASLKDEPCALLTAEMVAGVAGVAPDQVEQRAMSTMCLYEWDGGSASIGFIKIHDSATEAMDRFHMEHQSMSGAQVDAAMQEIAAGAKDQLAEDSAAGQDVPDAEHVDTVTDAMSGSMGGGITFEGVPDLGDMAAYETTRHETKIADKVLVSYANKLDTVIGNLTFDVTFTLDGDPTDGQMYKEQNIALVRAVIQALPD